MRSSGWNRRGETTSITRRGIWKDEGGRMKDESVLHPSSFTLHPLFMRIYAGTLNKSHAATTVTIAGWVQKHRDFGELAFIDVRDRSGIAQLVADSSNEVSHSLLSLA